MMCYAWYITHPLNYQVESVKALVRWATGKRLTNRLLKLSLTKDKAISIIQAVLIPLLIINTRIPRPQQQFGIVLSYLR